MQQRPKHATFNDKFEIVGLYLRRAVICALFEQKTHVAAEDELDDRESWHVQTASNWNKRNIPDIEIRSH